jgi:hypothetical protein
MYQELLPLQERLGEELRETIALQALPGMNPIKLLKAYIGQLTLYVGVDTSNKTLTAVVIDDAGASAPASTTRNSGATSSNTPTARGYCTTLAPPNTWEKYSPPMCATTRLTLT